MKLGGFRFSSSSSSSSSRRGPRRSLGFVPEEEVALGHTFLYVCPTSTETSSSSTTQPPPRPPPPPPRPPPQPPSPSSSASASPSPSSSPLRPSSEGKRKGRQHRHGFSFKSLSGATVSANPNTAPRLKNPLVPSDFASRGAFESSQAFSVTPFRLSPADREFFLSEPIAPVGRRRHSSALLSYSASSSSEHHFSRCRSETRNRRPSWVAPFRRNRGSLSSSRGGEGATKQWVQGRAGEDRMHVVVSEEQQWLFVGIYDGFNGTDAADFLLCRLFPAVFDELNALFLGPSSSSSSVDKQGVVRGRGVGINSPRPEDGGHASSWLGNWIPQLRYSCKQKGEAVEVLDNREWMRRMPPTKDHKLVLEALARALETTEATYFEMLEGASELRPEISLVGSCLLVVFVMGNDVYVMNLGDSRAIVARYRAAREEKEHTPCEEAGGSAAAHRGGGVFGEIKEEALQLSVEHSTSNADEVVKITEEHQDDMDCIVKSRVKGRLKITRAFGAAFLKEPKWNNRLLKMLRCKYIGTAPYVSSSPSLCHHRLDPDDKFLVISSDGIYQYMTNEEVVSHLQSFMENSPAGDPAQSLVEETLLRAADKAGMDLKGLLDIPLGDRRKLHDDASVVVISLAGRMLK